MDYSIFISGVTKHCNAIFDDGYSFRVLGRNILFEKRSEKECFCVNFGWTDYGYLLVSGLVARKSFLEIEKPIQTIVGGNLKDYYTICLGAENTEFSTTLKYFHSDGNLLFEIHTENDITEFANILKYFYYTQVIPFFDKYQDVGAVYSDYTKLNREDIPSLILNTGNNIFYRELSLKSFIGAPDVEDFYTMIIKELEPLRGNSVFDGIIENLAKINNYLCKTDKRTRH